MSVLDDGVQSFFFHCISGWFNTTREESLATSWEPSTTGDIQLLTLIAKQGGLESVEAGN